MASEPHFHHSTSCSSYCKPQSCPGYPDGDSGRWNPGCLPRALLPQTHTPQTHNFFLRLPGPWGWAPLVDPRSGVRGGTSTCIPSPCRVRSPFLKVPALPLAAPSQSACLSPAYTCSSLALEKPPIPLIPSRPWALRGPFREADMPSLVGQSHNGRWEQRREHGALGGSCWALFRGCGQAAPFSSPGRRGVGPGGGEKSKRQNVMTLIWKNLPLIKHPHSTNAENTCCGFHLSRNQMR